MRVGGSVEANDPRQRVGDDGVSDGRLPRAKLVSEVGGALANHRRLIEIVGWVGDVCSRKSDQGVAESSVVRARGQRLPYDAMGYGGGAGAGRFGVVALPRAMPRRVGEPVAPRTKVRIGVSVAFKAGRGPGCTAEDGNQGGALAGRRGAADGAVAPSDAGEKAGSRIGGGVKGGDAAGSLPLELSNPRRS